MAKYSLEELVLKIDHEGGIYEALRYGISPEDVPEEIRHDWHILVTLFRGVETQWRTISKQLPDEVEASRVLNDDLTFRY